jgi:carboxyl-terminal processing protease
VAGSLACAGQAAAAPATARIVRRAGLTSTVQTRPMPVRNIVTIVLMVVTCLASWSIAVRNRFAKIFAEAMTIVEQDALVEIPRRELFNAALDGMLSRLDGNSWFVSEEDIQSMEENLNQEFIGVGLHFEMDPEQNGILVVAPVPGKPAWEAGIRAGDLIVEIDGEPAGGMDSETAIRKIRGARGTPVRFTVRREQEPELLQFDVVRDEIEIESVMGDVWNSDGSWNFFLEKYPRVGYIRLVEFGRRSADEMRAALKSIEGKVDGLILDLRNNPGGLLDAAVEISDMFIGREVLIVQIRRRDMSVVDSPHFAHSKTDFDPHLPMVVLVNGYSASAAEIVAACLQDHDRAIIIGEQTYGKGTVQDLIPLEPNRSLLRLTTSSYWRPSGKNIDRTVLPVPEGGTYGVMPDDGFEVALTDEAEQEIMWMRIQRDRLTQAGSPAGTSEAAPWFERDLPVQRAVEFLLQQAASRAAETPPADSPPAVSPPVVVPPVVSLDPGKA